MESGWSDCWILVSIGSFTVKSTSQVFFFHCHAFFELRVKKIKEKMWTQSFLNFLQAKQSSKTHLQGTLLFLRKKCESSSIEMLLFENSCVFRIKHQTLIWELHLQVVLHWDLANIFEWEWRQHKKQTLNNRFITSTKYLLW